MIDWENLDRQEQIKLREAFGHHLDTLPPSCSLDMKIARFQEWLRHQGIQYTSKNKERNNE
jgi:phage antirepressor YoqD-like protein